MPKNCIIAGPTNAGKTTVARRLVREYGYSRIPGDPLVLAFQQRFPELGIGHELPGKTPAESHASSCRQFGPFLSAFANALSWESNMSYVLDTFHVRPADLQEIDRGKVNVIFMGYPDIDPAEKSRQTEKYQTELYGAPSEWPAVDVEKRADFFRIFIAMSAQIRSECAAYGWPFADMSNSFEKGISEAIALAVLPTATAISIIGFAAIPGIAVLPICWMFAT
jgi:hypothetical protein